MKNPASFFERISSWYNVLSDLDLTIVIEALRDTKNTTFNVFDVNKLYKREMLTDLCLKEIAKNMGTLLKKFDLSNCHITDASLKAIAKYSTKVTAFNLSCMFYKK
jgi:hypothetical protein